MNFAEYEDMLNKRFEELFKERQKEINKHYARAIICKTCTMLYEGSCTRCCNEAYYCDLEDYTPIDIFLNFLTTLANGSSDEAKSESKSE